MAAVSCVGHIPSALPPRTGQMRCTKTLCSGEEYVKYNSHPLFRCNTYFGVDGVFLYDLLNIPKSAGAIFRR